MKREIKNFVFRIQSILFKAKEIELESDDVVYIEAPLKVWEYVLEKIKEENK